MPRRTRSSRHSAPPVRIRRSRGRGTIALTVLLVLVLIAGIVGWRAWSMLTRPDHDIAAGVPVEVSIDKGSNTEAIAQKLSDVGVIANALRFRLTARQAAADADLKAGDYTLTTGMSDEAVIEALTTGPKIVFTDVTIPEGFTARQIAARFAKHTDVPEAELLALMTTGAPVLSAERPYLKGAYRDSLEGYLFPATYRVKEGVTAEQIVAMMLDKFEVEMESIDLTRAKTKNLTFQDVVIMGSIIEREARLDKERRLVSSVIYNRLKADMRLQLCATVLYEMPPGTTRLTYADLESDSPYNTYRNAGLPPGPISNPGRKSLQAAALPANTEYLYYVLTGADGSHTFTSSYAKFQSAVKDSRELTGD